MATETEQTLFEAIGGWEQLPEGMTLHETPGVAVDAVDRVYLLTRNTDNPVIVLDADGSFVRTFGAGVFSARTHAITAGPAIEARFPVATRWTYFSARSAMVYRSEIQHHDRCSESLAASATPRDFRDFPHYPVVCARPLCIGRVV